MGADAAPSNSSSKLIASTCLRLVPCAGLDEEEFSAASAKKAAGEMLALEEAAAGTAGESLLTAGFLAAAPGSSSSALRLGASLDAAPPLGLAKKDRMSIVRDCKKWRQATNDFGG